MTTCHSLRILKIKKIKKNSLSHYFHHTLYLPHTISSSFKLLSLSQTSSVSSLSFSNLFIVFSVFLKPLQFLLCFSQTSSASSSLSKSLTHNTIANTTSLASSLSFSLTQNTIFLILHTSLPFLRDFISVFLTQTFRSIKKIIVLVIFCLISSFDLDFALRSALYLFYFCVVLMFCSQNYEQHEEHKKGNNFSAIFRSSTIFN